MEKKFLTLYGRARITDAEQDLAIVDLRYIPEYNVNVVTKILKGGGVVEGCWSNHKQIKLREINQIFSKTDIFCHDKEV